MTGIDLSRLVHDAVRRSREQIRVTLDLSDDLSVGTMSGVRILGDGLAEEPIDRWARIVYREWPARDGRPVSFDVTFSDGTRFGGELPQSWVDRRCVEFVATGRVRP